MDIGTDEESLGLGGDSHHFSDNQQHNLKMAFNKEHKRPSKKWPPAKVPESHAQCINDAMADNDELTASDLKDILVMKFGADNVQYGERTIARIRNELGWTYSTARYCQAIRDANKQKRLDWCTKLIAEKEKFDDVIFTDESTFQLECHRRKCFRKKKMPRKLKYKHKHPPKIHVWAGISKKGATKIVLFSGIMTATRYSDILSASLVPFLKEKYPHGHRLYQDNDPKHTSKYVQRFFCSKWSTVVEESS